MGLPGGLPPVGSNDRWPWLQRLRRQSGLDPEPWLCALEAGNLEPRHDLLTVLADQLDPTAQLRLLRCWRRLPQPDPALAALVARDRHPATAAWLSNQLTAGPAALGPALPPEVAAALLPLLGHQRQPSAWPLLRQWLQAPISQQLRQAALDGVARGLSIWPRRSLAELLGTLATDLDPALAAMAVDLLARLPAARRTLVPLSRQPLDPAVAARLGRRLATLPVEPLLLVVHGRAGGELPAELSELAAELERRRGAPVRIQALTAFAPPDPAELVRPLLPISLVPLLLLPGGHVRHDIPELAAQWRRHGPVRRWPFLGAWPAWQALLRRELQQLAGAARTTAQPPLLLHHPLAHPLAGRYLAHLAACCGGDCLPASFDEPVESPADDPSVRAGAVMLPLALATNRLTERLALRFGAAAAAPLLLRPGPRQCLLELLEELP